MVRFSILFILFSFTFNTTFAGGPWTPEQGKGYLKISEWWVVFDQHYTDTGNIDPNVTSGVFNTFAYGEIGIKPRLTGILNAALFSRNYMNNLVSGTTNEVLVPGEALNSIGDIDVGIKYRLTKDDAKLPISVSLFFGIPTGNPAGGSQGNLQTGDGEFNQMIQFDAGKSYSLGSLPSYASAFVGFNNRTNQFSEELRFGAETGIGFFDSKLWLAAKLFIVESLKNGATAETVNSTSLFANNSEFKSLQIESSVYLNKRVGLSASVATAFAGEIIAAAPSYSFGVFFDLH